MMLRERDRVNRYVCPKCWTEMITVQPGVGLVPYEVKCQTKSCGGFARSQFYRVGLGATPKWEFYSPQITDLHSWFDKWKHTNNQLFLRRIEEPHDAA